MAIEIIQVNLQTEFGGGEVYTQFLSKALLALNIPTRIIRHHTADFWDKLDIPEHCFINAHSIQDLPGILGTGPKFILSHGPLPPAITTQLKQHFLVTIAHMPLTGRNPKPYEAYHAIIPVSHYVLDTLKLAGFRTTEPLYGIANPDMLMKANETIYQTSHYHWDKRKGRDVVLSYLEPLYRKLHRPVTFNKLPGITLSLVSRITTIKQFPALFQYIAPIIQEFPNINIEIFGSGGYASVRDLKRKLKPIQKQVRFWGQQWAVASIYKQSDYILSGLPEREALGLNLLEAQACNTPVIAVNAPPFTETVNPNISGLLYTDPRQDNGADFRRILNLITKNPPTLIPAKSPHLIKFSLNHFEETLYNIMQNLTEQYQNHMMSES